MFQQFLRRSGARPSLLRPTLLTIELIDELTAGLSVVALPLLRDHAGLNYAQIGLLFTLAELTGLFFDPVMSVMSDRGSKRWWIIGGLAGVSLAYMLIGNVRSYWLLIAAFMLMAPCGSAAVGLSQAALIALATTSSVRAMTRWTLLGSMGDLLAPLTVTLAAFLGVGWTGLCWFAGVIWLSTALVMLPQRFPRSQVHDDTGGNDDTQAGILAGLRMALRDPVLLRWAALSTIPTMMDEVFLGFVSLYLRDALHASQALIGVIIAIDMAGSLCGLLVIERILRHSKIRPERLLIWLALLALAGVVGFLTIHALWIAAFMLFVTSLGVTGWYPIAKAAAYDRLPGRSGTVRAVVSLGGPFEMALPGIVGFVAARFGLLAGLSLLALAPVLMLLLVPKR